MKVNLDGQYKEISRFLQSGQANNSADAKPGQFSALLGSLLSAQQQLPEVLSKKLSNEVAHSSQSKLQQERASLKSSLPSMQFPEMPKSISPDINVKPSEEYVKTPALLDARRLNTQNISLQIDDKQPANTIKQVKALIKAAGEKHGVDPILSMAVASAESSFDPQAVSKDGHASKGIFQLLDSTAKELLAEQDQDPANYEPFNPPMNVDLGVRYLRRLHELFSTETLLIGKARTFAAANSTSLEKLAVAAFNAGEGRVAAAQNMAQRAGRNPTEFDEIESYLPDITQQYVKRVFLAKSRFEAGATES